jgi:hypothetical protein
MGADRLLFPATRHRELHVIDGENRHPPAVVSPGCRRRRERAGG